MTAEVWFHLAELAVMVFGMALPLLWGAFRLMSLLRDYPPHRHINGTILFPRGYEPPETEKLTLSSQQFKP
jgi:hypothetical protein